MPGQEPNQNPASSQHRTAGPQRNQSLSTIKITLRDLAPPIWRRACPPDDCGGVPGYAQLMEARRNPADKANAELLEWCGEWDPETFDLEFVNQMLSR